FLHDNQISDLSPLYDLKNLQILTLNNNPIDESHIIELKSHLPNCKISYTPTPGHVLGNIDVTIFDGIEILKYLVGIESVIDDSKVALEAAMLTAESKARGEPTIFDFVEILLILVGM
ncbi:MAG: leucine-rich repeat domain-containing protein, partial [Oscillospiraceae bacterium]|nr:leucine-rich repeat domain-containing protein [Oscillospiraceae bacterium]